ncbi:MAG: FkbM family methyltransferase [Chloroflexaceae bacterium]|nr:FkbM family methyltransferase [Chloroflexaceae bacterium]
MRFEPRETASDNPFITTIDAALWDRAEERDFYIYRGRKGSGSSLFPQNVDYVRANFEQLRTRGPSYLAETWFERSQLERVERIACRTLDSILLAPGQRIQYHFLKVDAQGAEYQVLRGGETFLRGGCVGLHLELFEIPLYQGMTLLPEVVEYVATLGFEPVRKLPAHSTFNSQYDVIFLKRGVQGAVIDTIRQVYALT